MLEFNKLPCLRNFFAALFQPRTVKSIKFIITTAFTLITVSVVLVFAFLLYSKFSDAAEKAASSNTQQITEQVGLNVEYYLKGMKEIYDLVSNKLVSSPSISSPELTGELYTILRTRKDIVSLAVFSDHGELVSVVPSMKMRKNSRLTYQSWFYSALADPGSLLFSSPHIQNAFEGDYKWVVSLSKEITTYSNAKTLHGVLLVDVNFRTIDDLCRRVNLGSRGYIYIVDSSGDIVYHPQQQLIYVGLKNEDTKKMLKFTDGSYRDHSDGEAKLYTIKTIHDANWKIIAVSYLDEIVATKNETGAFILWLLAFVIIIAFLLTAFTSAKISQPIEKLEKSIEIVENGDFNITVDVKGVNEVEQLSKRFNLMVLRIRQLMGQIILEQEAKRRSELNVLQAQITPHFLYNTLNSVVRMIGNGRDDDAITMITSLSKFFRISLSKGKNIISIQDELEHVRNYLTIQKIRYKNKFEFKIEAQEDILQCKTMKLILQPIVENAIYHGIEHMEDEGLIKISAAADDGKILFQVLDNGLGIKPGILENLLSEEAKSRDGSGVGLKNVHERLKVYFGEEYGVKVESEPDEGTNVKIWIPIVREDE